MRSFMRDRLGEAVIGPLIATFVSCVLVLRRMDATTAGPAPRCR